MFYLHTSNRTESLLEQMIAVYRFDEKISVFETEHILIQSQGMERMISQSMADAFGSWCNFKYHLPLGFFKYIGEQLDIQIDDSSFERDSLTWRIEKILRHVDEADSSLLNHFLSSERNWLKRFQLASSLANLFDQYQIMRPEMLVRWEQGQKVTQDPSEDWQMWVWNKLLSEGWGNKHRGFLVNEISRELIEKDVSGISLPSRFSVFGVHTLPPVFLRAIYSLSAHVDVHLYLMAPSKHYWTETARKRFLAQQETELAGEGEDIKAWEHHPLLVSLGKQGRSFQKMLLGEVEYKIDFDSFEEEYDEQGGSVLNCLQADLLNDRFSKCEDEEVINDDSVRVVSCHSKFREVTVLKDHLLQLLYNDPSLELRDIIVMAPDMGEYGSLIPAVFNNIQHSIADRKIAESNKSFSNILELLALFQGRYGVEDVLAVLRLPGIYKGLGIGENELLKLQNWIADSGIRWGLTEKNRMDYGLPGFRENSWQSGLERLLLGFCMSSNESYDDIYPFEGIEGADGRLLGILCHFIATLEGGAGFIRELHCLHDWLEFLHKIVADIFIENDSGEVMEIQVILDDLRDSGIDYHDEPIHFEVILEWLRFKAGETRSSSGFLRGQLTFCSMLPMRSIPFKVICLIGMNDGEFPKRDVHSTFDLISRLPKTGDRSARNDDRYQFLEALLAAREVLYISYIGQSIKTNEKVPPSVVIEELLEVLHYGYGLENIVIQHPLQPFSRKYFLKENERLFSYDKLYCEAARQLGGVKTKTSWWAGQREVEVELIELQDLLQFYKNPQRWFVRACLGIRVGDSIAQPESKESFMVDGLDEFILTQKMVETALNPESAAVDHAQLVAKGSWPLGASGQLLLEHRMGEINEFTNQLKGLALGEPMEDISFEIECNRLKIKGVLTGVYENGILRFRHGKRKGVDLLQAWLIHLIARQVEGCPSKVIIGDLDGLAEFDKSLVDDTLNLPDLEKMVEVYLEGCKQPSELFVEPAYTYVIKKNSKRSGGIDAARDAALEKIVDYIEKGYEPEWELILRGLAGDEIVTEPFQIICSEVFEPVWRQVNGS